uniref:Golgin-84 n=1 Tax=Rhizophora mucronata TaxID=61149 RepID=A0A2P2M9R0_RHIMU
MLITILAFEVGEESELRTCRQWPDCNSMSSPNVICHATTVRQGDNPPQNKHVVMCKSLIWMTTTALDPRVPLICQLFGCRIYVETHLQT